MAVLVYTVAVILWGAVVRATGSGAGCGDEWLLCEGELVPTDPSAAKATEYAHRATSGAAWFLVAAMFGWARRRYASGHLARTAAGWSLLLMTTEALLGAGLVIFEMVAGNTSMVRALWVTAHLANTFILLGALTVAVWGAFGGSWPAFEQHAAARRRVTIAMAAVLVLSMSGALAALGDTLFPAASLAAGVAADFDPHAHPWVRFRALHPLLALCTAPLLLYFIAYESTRGHRRPVRGLLALVGMIFVVQAGVGLANLAFLTPVGLQLVHLGLADALWICLVFLALALGVPNRGVVTRSSSQLDPHVVRV